MKERQCDKCHKTIPKGTKYIKVCESQTDNQVQRLNHIGDLCLPCWKEIKR